jgi:glyoxylase-like metal-dependent hydrolase (beta-lactamase superfamily II)
MKLIFEDVNTNVWQITNSLVKSNTFVLEVIAQENYLVVIDPGSNVGEMFDEMPHFASKKFCILLTHGHFDHVVGIGYFLSHASEIYLHKDDAVHINRNNFYLKALEHDYTIPQFSWKHIDDFDSALFGISVMLCPGHTEGSVVYIINNLVLTGDSLLANSIIAPTVKGNNPKQQVDSIKNLLGQFKNATLFLPGHGPALTFEELLSVNSEFSQLVQTGVNPWA